MQHDFSHLTEVNIIGDIHGCISELDTLLDQLDDRFTCFVGDLTDRGPDSLSTFNRVMERVNNGRAICVRGNHDDKLRRALQGNNVVMVHGLDETLRQFRTRLSEAELDSAWNWLGRLPLWAMFDGGKLVVAHAGMKRHHFDERRDPFNRRGLDFCLFGETDGTKTSEGFPNRTFEFCKDWNDEKVLVFGHTPVKDMVKRNNTYNVDLGCAFGGHLCCLQYPEMNVVKVPAYGTYSYKDGFAHNEE